MPEQSYPQPSASHHNPPESWGVEYFLDLFAVQFIEANPGTPEHAVAYRNLFLGATTLAALEAEGQERVTALQLSTLFEREITLVALARWATRLPEQARHPATDIRGWRHEYRRVLAGLQVPDDIELQGLTPVEFLTLLAEGHITHWLHDGLPDASRRVHKRNHKHPPARRSVLRQAPTTLPSSDVSAA